MTQEDKELLLKDLCARLPYGVKITWNEKHWVTVTPSMYSFICEEQEFTWKPYFRPISSMTEDEKEELRLSYAFLYSDYPFDDEDEDEDSIEGHYEPSVETFDWYNKKMFDYRGLIEKGLALEAPEGMYKM